MDHLELHASANRVERAKVEIYQLVSRCIRDIEKTVSTSGITMRDTGVSTERYRTTDNSCIIELKLST